jgi:hypothetical protein
MSLYRTAFPLLIACTLSTAALADAPPPQPAVSCSHTGMMQTLTPEEQSVLFMQMRQDTANMTQDQRKAYRQSQRDKFMAMSEADQQKFAVDLKAKWDALPTDQKARIQEEHASFQAKHPMMGRMMGNHCS